ncbi:hypothetical protein [Massilia sp. TWP1-3-3]|uniref:hypothetical protein n=1 Tax=Massilia sp. TWP1-3-3 TaxID=2804573 RepID=UPI003CFAE05B
MEAKENLPEQRQQQVAQTANDDHKDHKCHHRPPHHIHELENKIRHLLDALAHLGRGSNLQELLRIIRWPGWTTPAELAFVHAILEHIGAQVHTLERRQDDLVEASWRPQA